jgi:AraC-like DNA-binding protein/ligand-binding sensor protein
MGEPALSALGQLIELLEESTGCRISFEDLTGVSYHVEDLALPGRLRIHTCEACMFAKSRRETHADCIRNKTAVNRLATRRKKMFSGQCHIGLTELVAPLMYQGRVMGVFFLGSVVVRETATEARRKLRRYCERQGLDSRPFLAALAKAPQISAKEIPSLEARFHFLVRVAEALVEKSALPAERYRTVDGAHKVALHLLPVMVQGAIRFLQRHHAKAVLLGDIAEHLSRILNRHLPGGLSGYLSRIRIEHAQKLIAGGRLSMGEISDRVGFTDQSYFAKTFRKLVGMTPGDYQTRLDS